MEFNDLLGDDRFIESYNSVSRRKGRQMKPKVKQGGCYFELSDVDLNNTTRPSAKWVSLTVDTTDRLRNNHYKKQFKVNKHGLNRTS